MRDTVTECDLPGIGRKYTFTAPSGEQLAIVVHQAGTRELFIFPGSGGALGPSPSRMTRPAGSAPSSAGPTTSQRSSRTWR
jgi:hypothetical protein